MHEDEQDWFAGVDWASQTHHVCVSDARGRKLGERAFAHGGAGLAEMAGFILKLTGTSADKVFVAIEVPHGPVVESLMNAASAFTPSIPSSSTASATASRRPAPRMTAVTPRCSPVR